MEKARQREEAKKEKEMLKEKKAAERAAIKREKDAEKEAIKQEKEKKDGRRKKSTELPAILPDSPTFFGAVFCISCCTCFAF